MKKVFLKVILPILGSIVAGFGIVFGIMSKLNKFGFISDAAFKSPIVFVIYVETSIIIGLFVFIKKRCFSAPKDEATGDKANSDSIIEIITQAYDQKRYSEVIYMGNALSEYLWYSGRKDLRLKIAGLVLDAAEKTNDSYTQARVLIDDAGNTQMKMSGNSGIKQSLKYISEGIKIAEDNKYNYLLIRGYRNYACALAYKYSQASTKSVSDLDEASQVIEKGKKLINELTDEWEKADSEAALCYAEYRVAQNRGMRDEVINSLLRAKELYESYTERSNVKKNLAIERLKKIYRELGIVYISAEEEQYREDGRKLLVKSMDICEADNDINNMLRAALVLLESDYAAENKEYITPIVRRVKNVLPQVDENSEYVKKIKEVLSENNKK